MKFGQLIEYNMRNIFVEKSYTKCGGETIPSPFSKKSKLSISLDQLSKALSSLLLLYVNLRAIKIQWNQAEDHLLLPYIELFKKLKGGLVLVSLPHFLREFWRKMFLLSTDQISLPGCLYNSWDIEQCLLTWLWRHKFQNWSTFLIKLFSLHEQKVKTAI